MAVSFFGDVLPEIEERRKGVSLATLRTARCKLCPLDKQDLDYQKIRPRGPAQSDVYILGSSPEFLYEDSGDYLRRYIPKELKPRVWTAIRCNSPTGHSPSWVETESCRPFMEEDIEACKPKKILLVGAGALRWAKNSGRILDWNGEWIPLTIGSHSCWAMPIIDPDQILDKEKSEFEVCIFDKAMDRFLGPVPKQNPKAKTLSYYDDRISICKDKKELGVFLKSAPLAFDIETTSDEEGERAFRPYSKGAGILSVAISNGKETIVLVSPKMIDSFVDQIGEHSQLIAHNLVFDLEWLFYFYPELQTLPAEVWHCSMAMIYILNSGMRGRSLDEQVKMRLGIEGLKAQSGVDVSNLKNASKSSLAVYNGRDAAITYDLARILLRRLQEGYQMDVYSEQGIRLVTAVAAQCRGFPVDIGAAEDLQKEMEKQIEEEYSKISKNKDVIKFGGLNPLSSDEVIKFFQSMGFEKEVISEKNKRGTSSDDDVLKKIRHPVSASVKEIRNLVKTKSTYVDGLLDGLIWPDNKIHPRYNMSSLVTRRTSCAAPNIQNYPKRNRWYGPVRAIYKKPGYKMVSMDYGQIEARVVAMASRDRNLVDAFRNRYDIHADWGERLRGNFPGYSEESLEEEFSEFPNPARQKAKMWVFGLLFGETLKGAAKHLEVDMEDAKKPYYSFWDNYPEVRSWHQKLVLSYEREGYVEMLTGFRRHGPMRYNMIINTPIQGAASDIVVDCWNRIYLQSIELDKPWLLPPVEIHDDLVAVVPAKKVDEFIEIATKTAFDCPFDFVNVPLSVGFSVGDDWGSLKSIGEVFSDSPK